MIVKQINQKICYFKFGLKSLMLLSSFSQISDEAKKLILEAIAVQKIELKDFQQDFDSIILQTFKDAFEDSKVSDISSLEDMLSYIKRRDLQTEINELYSKAVGQVGISPTAFYSMTPFEIDLAYIGYIHRQELQANCFLIAARKNRDKKAELISLIGGQGVTESTMGMRNKTFETLNI